MTDSPDLPGSTADWRDVPEDHPLPVPSVPTTRFVGTWRPDAARDAAALSSVVDGRGVFGRVALVAGLLLLGFVLTVVPLVLTRGATVDPASATLARTSVGAGLLAMLVGLGLLGLRRGPRRAARRIAGLGDHVVVELHDHVVVLFQHEAVSALPWSAFQHWTLRDNLVVLQDGDGRLTVFSLNAFPPGRRRAIQRFLASKVAQLEY